MSGHRIRKEMARDIVHKNSMKLLLDFHYSHWWADPEHQKVPLQWRDRNADRDADNENEGANGIYDAGADNETGTGMKPATTTLGILKGHVYNHTRKVMEEFIAQGTIPSAVQIGNEVDSGMLWEEGRIKYGDMNNFVELTNSAIGAIEDSFSSMNVNTNAENNNVPSSGTDDDADADADADVGTHGTFPLIVMHLAAGGLVEFTEQWCTNFTKAGGKFDVLGLSYYPLRRHGAGSLQDLSDNMKNIKQIFPDKSVWVVESAYYWTETETSVRENDTFEATSSKSKSDDNKLPFDQTEDGQYHYLKALLDVLKDYGNATAVFYGGSHWTQPHLWMFGNSTINIQNHETWEEAGKRSLFDSNAQALRGIDALIMS